jgi:hypothetical protein
VLSDGTELPAGEEGKGQVAHHGVLLIRPHEEWKKGLLLLRAGVTSEDEEVELIEPLDRTRFEIEDGIHLVPRSAQPLLKLAAVEKVELLGERGGR